MSSVRPFEIQDLPELRRLFRGYPFKERQQRVQGLDPDRLAEQFVEAERRRFDVPGRECVGRWVGVDDSGDVRAFASLSADDWHSRFYDLSFGRIAPFLTNAADDGLRDDLLDQLLDTARIAGFNHLITRVDGSEFAAQRALASRGFNLVDVSVKMSGPIAGGAPPAIDPDMAVRSYRDSDLPTLMGMVATSHPHNHYYNDPHLSKDGTDRLFGAWVERCCSGLASHVYILERQGEPVGFILYLTPKSLNERMGTRLVILDFVCIDANARGAGLGRRLISETLGRLSTEFDQIELRTSHNNYAALKCYADLGMRIVSTDFVLHRNG